MSIATDEPKTGLSPKEEDGPVWIDRQAKGHEFGPRPGVGNSNQNMNLLLTIRKPICLRFPRFVGKGARGKTASGGERLMLLPNTEVVIYRQYEGAQGQRAIATFFSYGQQLGQVTQTTLYAGPKLKVRHLDRRF